MKKICKALDTPYQPLFYTYGKTLNEDQENYGFVNYIPYNKIIAIDNINSLMDCPSTVPSSSIAAKVNDNAMEKSLKINSYVFIEFNALLDNDNIGLFYLNKNFILRKYSCVDGKITLKAENVEFPDIKIKDDDEFYIIGKVVG